MPTAEAAHSGKWAIMGCTLEDPSPKWPQWSVIINLLPARLLRKESDY